MISIKHLMTPDIIIKHHQYIRKSLFSKTLENFINEVESGEFQKEETVLYAKKYDFDQDELLEEIKLFLQMIKNEYDEFKDEKNIYINRDKYIFTCSPKNHLDYIIKFEKEYKNVYNYLKSTLKTTGNKILKPYKKWLNLFDYKSFSDIGLKTSNLYNELVKLSQHEIYNDAKGPKGRKQSNYHHYMKAVVDRLMDIQKNYPDSKAYIDGLLEKVKDINSIGTEPNVRSRFINFFRNDSVKNPNTWDVTLKNYKILYSSNTWGGYDYVMELGLMTCPYCNRQYITPVHSESGKVRADLDHFYSKSKYPYFALSIYNLVPSCKSCNSSLKNDKDFCMSTHLHPYISSMENVSFGYSTDASTIRKNFKYEITLDKSKASKQEIGNIEVFKLETLYGYHDRELENLIAIRLAYSNMKIGNLKDELKEVLGKDYSEADIIAKVTAVPRKFEDFHEKPLSKFRYDILIKLGLSREKQIDDLSNERKLELMKL